MQSDELKDKTSYKDKSEFCKRFSKRHLALGSGLVGMP